MDPNEYFGFVYRITNLTNGRAYIGRKQYKRGGKKTTRGYGTETDWRFYTGSSKWLNEDIQALGHDQFIFECMAQCYSKGGLHYFEVFAQVFCEVLTAKLENGERAYYNGNINATKFIPKEPISMELKEKIIPYAT